MPADRLAGTPRRARVPTVLAILGLAVASVVLTGCEDGPATPGELFDQGCNAMISGRPGVFWDLMTLEQQKSVREMVDGTKRVVERNPGARNLVEQWGFQQSEWREFVRCPAPELWKRAHTGMEKVLVGVKILDAATDPETGRDVLVTFETVYGQQFRWVMRRDPGRGWRFQHQAMVGSGESAGTPAAPR